MPSANLSILPHFLFIVEPLQHLINEPFNRRVVPDSLKVVGLCLVYKTGRKSTFSNYRLISILPSFSKIYEKLVYNRRIDYQ